MKGIDIKYGRVRAACLFSLRSKSPVSSSIKFSHLNNCRTQKQPDTTLLCCFCSYSSYLLQNIRSQYGSLHLFSLIVWYDLIDEVSSPFSDFFPFSSLNEARSPSGFFFFSPAAGSMGKTVCYWFRYIPNSCLHPVDRTFQIKSAH